MPEEVRNVSFSGQALYLFKFLQSTASFSLWTERAGCICQTKAVGGPASVLPCASGSCRVEPPTAPCERPTAEWQRSLIRWPIGLTCAL